MIKYFFIFFSFWASVNADSTINEIKNILQDSSLSQNNLRSINRGKILSNAQLMSISKLEQSLLFKIHALHPISCRRSFRKISQYQEYSNYINFIKKSSYHEKNKLVYLKLKPPIIKKYFVMEFKIPRIREAGTYQFIFTKGFLKNLKGKITVSNLKNKKCLISMNGLWKGKKLKYPSKLFEFFTQTVLEIGLKKLIRISTI